MNEGFSNEKPFKVWANKYLNMEIKNNIGIHIVAKWNHHICA